MKELINLHDEIIDIYGYMVQVGVAIGEWNKILNSQIISKKTKPSNTMFFGKDDPNIPDAKYQYKRTIGELISASANDGITSVIHRRSVIVLIVASWEDHYRKQIADECGLLNKNEVKSDVFRDLNHCRQAILHRGGKLKEKPKMLRFFHQGDRVALTGEQMESIFRMLIEELNRIGTDLYGKNPRFDFDKQLSNKG